MNEKIVPARKGHSREIAELHYAYTKSLLRDLGRRMCIIFYEKALESKDNFGLVYIKKSKVLGFIFATKDNSRPFKRPRIIWELVLALVRRPWLIRRLIFHLTRRSSPAPELLYSALDERYRGRGIGKKLYKANHEECRKRGLAYYEVRVDSDNYAALNIVKQLGGTIVERFVENGLMRYRLRIDLFKEAEKN